MCRRRFDARRPNGCDAAEVEPFETLQARPSQWLVAQAINRGSLEAADKACWCALGGEQIVLYAREESWRSLYARPGADADAVLRATHTAP